MKISILSLLAVCLSLPSIWASCKCKMPPYLTGRLSSKTAPDSGNFYLNFERNVHVMNISFVVPMINLKTHLVVVNNPNEKALHWKMLEPAPKACLDGTDDTKLKWFPRRCVPKGLKHDGTRYNVKVTSGDVCKVKDIEMDSFFFGKEFAMKEFETSTDEALNDFKDYFTKCEQGSKVFK